jgi:hypothetical protein
MTHFWSQNGSLTLHQFFEFHQNKKEANASNHQILPEQAKEKFQNIEGTYLSENFRPLKQKKN